MHEHKRQYPLKFKIIVLSPIYKVEVSRLVKKQQI